MIWICFLLVFLLGSSVLFFYRHKIENTISIWIDNKLDYERSLEVGDELNKLVWGDLSFQINHYKIGNKLDYVKDNKRTTILNSVINYKIYDDKLYVIADNGCAIIDGNNKLKIYSTKEIKLFIDNATYLTSYNDFDIYEYNILKKLEPFGYSLKSKRAN